MANLGKLTAAGISATNETTLAFANINLDFSLWKVEAPKEYGELGRTLNPWRREKAESGPEHRTARKLGALFEQVVNPSEELVKAYGNRVSQISSTTEATYHQQRTKYGLFRDQAGPDGTAIWAAARSGTSAIAVLLLAAMLARMWDAPKAISIWSEIVEKRKEEITLHCDGSAASHYHQIVAAQQEITRRELSEWDASARSWLNVADQVKEQQHRDMETILMQLSLPVDPSRNVYDSVVRAWKTAMSTMDNLLRGMPQHVNNSAVLIAIAAWHIYPDVELFGSTKRFLSQKDDLVPRGGRITVGLEDKDPNSAVGVHWSLSLANLQFYGAPVLKTGHAVDESRVSINDFALVCLGSIFAAWQGDYFDAMYDYRDGAEIMLALWDSLEHAEFSGLDGCPSPRDVVAAPKTWLHLLVEAAKELLGGDDSSRKRALRLLRCGIQRGHSFVNIRTGLPFFGLLDLNVLASSATVGKDPECIRSMCEILQLSRQFSQCIIQYQEPNRPASSGYFEFATAFIPNSDGQVQFGDTDHPSAYHVRWIRRHRAEDRKPVILAVGERCQEFAPRDIRFDNKCLSWSKDDPSGTDAGQKTEIYEYLFGNRFGNAVLVLSQDSEKPSSEFSATTSMTIKGLKSLLDSRHLDGAKLLEQILFNIGLRFETDSALRRKPLVKTDKIGEFGRSMQFLCVISQIYSSLPGATVSMRIVDQSLHTPSWLLDWAQRVSLPIDLLKPARLNLSETFSCIAMAETGSLQISSEELENAFALSTGNSIYAAASLFADPSESCQDFELKRIIGNVGIAGLSILIPPECPALQDPNVDSWSVINHEPFTEESQCMDSFENTSLHLSFTGYKQPVASSVIQGAQDVEAHYIEAVVSVFDGSKRVGDLDILGSMRSKTFQKLGICSNATTGHADLALDKLNVAFRWTSIDSWNELMKMPNNRTCIVRAHGNALSRIATSVVCVQKGVETCVILPPDVCCKCLVSTVGAGGLRQGGAQVLIC